MGLFIKEDGHFQGWLAALLCCWAAVNEDEHPIEKRNISRPTTARNTIWNEQPTPLKPMPYFPTNSTSTSGSYSMNRNNTYRGPDAVSFDDEDRVRPISERPPSLRPLSLGEPSLLDRMHLQARRKSSTNLQMRISIGKPMDFRRLEYSEKQRMSLKPLQLSPVVLRDATPDGDADDAPTRRYSRPRDDFDNSSDRNSYRASRGTPFERCQQLSAIPSSSSPSAFVTERGQVIMEPAKTQQVSKPTLSTRSSSSSMRSLRRQAMETNAASTSAPSSERIRLKRKRSSQKNSSESTDLDVDREILELNTIIEERRAEATRPQTPGGGHVAAVAPLMSVRARSETLTDIGSAFSRPLISLSTSTSAVEPETTGSAVSPIEASTKSRLSRPFLSMPDVSAFEQTEHQPQRPTRRSSSRVTGWLSNLLGSSAPSDSYQPSSRNRAVSEVSTELDSPMASSPMSKSGHSRSLTAESRLTPISPPSTVDEEMEEPGKETEAWPMIVRHPSQVGLAL